MPYPGVPSSLTKKMESCVAQVVASGKKKENAIAICHSRLVPKKDLTLMERDDVIRYAWAEAVRESSDEQLRYSWPSYIFDDYLVIRYAGRYIKVGYKMGGDEGVRFDSPKEWKQVEHSFKSQALVDDGTTHQIVLEPIRAVVEQTGQAEQGGAIAGGAGGASGTDEAKTWYKGYVYIFGDKDHKDLKGTYFDRRTESHLDWWPVRPWLYHHGLHPMVGSMKVGEWGESGEDEKGIFLKGEMDESFKFKDQAKTLIENEMLYTSSGSLGYLVRVEDDGHMAEWPVAELSSTVKPAEFRIQPITEAVASAIRTLEGGIDMAGKGDGGLFRILPWLAKRDGEAVAEAEPTTPEVPATPAVPAEPVAAVATPAPVADATPAEAPAGVATDTGAAAAVVTAQDLIGVQRSMDELANTVNLLRQGIEAVAGKVVGIEQTVRGLSQQESARVKSFVVGDSWIKGLFSATKDGEALPQNAPPSNEAHADGAVEVDQKSPASRVIFSRQR